MSDLSIASRVAVQDAGAARVLALPTGIRDVVSFRGSFHTGPDLGANDDVVQDLVTDVLDKGTRHRDRFEIAEALEGRGARLSFYSDGLRAGFAGRCLRDDLDDVLALLAEQLREPAMDDDEIDKARRKTIASVRRATESTGAMASGAFSRRLYGPAHPNHVLSPEDEMATLEAITPEAVRRYHAEHFGSDDLLVSFVGDVDPEPLATRVREALGAWPAHGLTATFVPSALAPEAARETVPMTDKQNLDVRLGHALPITRADDAFLPLFAGVFALGGNFSGRLMQTVRDEQGLTYGVSSRMGGVAVEHDMDVRVAISLSQENLDRGIEATRAVVDEWASGGITEEELERTQATLIGQHAVALATTGGVAARLLVNAERGFDLSYLDRYVDRVGALTAPEVSAHIQRFVDPERFVQVVAGSVVR
ncbi:M16 family metallopeptidase [Rubricoccus marinus]|uniref:Peptidase M16 C-terminal domain-containing protein n=1 Tax=Rubricoccus marinus TaxID=716817 RepID=A0A259TXP6_9BACT|nr:pitrilysin family protein [Rubricoccus marinus]OZC02545.1 hypothetical protein BSZ36_05875 [Rubricoccus marinus]